MAVKAPLVSRRRFEELRQRHRAMSAVHERMVAQRESAMEAVSLRLEATAARLDNTVESLHSREGMLSELAGVLGRIPLAPIACCRSQPEWSAFGASPECQRSKVEDKAILACHQFEAAWTLTGYSVPAGQFVNFTVDLLWGGRRNGDRFVPNIRERLVCPISGLNNRQRLMACLIATELSARTNTSSVYFMEQITPI